MIARDKLRAIRLDRDVARADRSAIESQIARQPAHGRLGGRPPTSGSIEIAMPGFSYAKRNCVLRRVRSSTRRPRSLTITWPLLITIDCIVIGGAPRPPVLRRVFTNRLKFHPASSRCSRIVGLSSVIESRITPSEIIVSGLYSTVELVHRDGGLPFVTQRHPLERNAREDVAAETRDGELAVQVLRGLGDRFLAQPVLEPARLRHRDAGAEQDDERQHGNRHVAREPARARIAGPPTPRTPGRC